MSESDYDSEIINIDFAVDVITKFLVGKYKEFDFKNKIYFDENFFRYKYSEDLNFDVRLRFYYSRIILHIFTNNYSDSYIENKDLEMEYLLTKIRELKEEFSLESVIKESVLDVYNLKNNYSYSKILDNVEPKNDVKLKEQIHLSRMILSHNVLDNCCVCLEPNIVLTLCNHNLCRECHQKITNNKKHPVCPICRMCLNCEDYEDYED